MADNFGFVKEEDLGFVPEENLGFKPELELESALDNEKKQIEQQKLNRLEQAKKEEAFQKFYADIAKANKLDPNPDDPQHFYDYRAYFNAIQEGRAQPPQYRPEHKQLRMPDEFKLPGHPDYYTNTDPETWTLEQTQKYIKEHPAQDLKEEVAFGTLLDKKKKENKLLRKIPEIIADKEKQYQRPLTGEERAQAVVDIVNKEKGIEPGLGTKIKRALTGPEGQAVTKSVLFPEYTVLEGLRGAIDESGQYSLLDRIKRGILEPEKTKRFYEHIKGAEALPGWSKITADIAEDILALSSMGLAKGAIKGELIRRNVVRKIDKAATQFAEENASKFMPAGWKAEAALKAELKDDFTNRLLATVTAPEVEGGMAGTLGKLKGGMEPSVLEKYIQRQSFLKLVSEEIRSLGQSGEIPLSRHFTIENGIIKPGPGLVEAAELIRQASVPKQEILDKIVRAAALESGAHLIPGSENTPTERRAKSAKSIALKVARMQAEGDTGYGIGDVSDHTRNAILVNTWEDVPAVLNSLAEKGNFTIEPMISAPHKSGYRGIFLKTTLGDGINGEIQLHSDASWKLKKETDEAYRVFRERSIADLSKEESDKLLQIRDDIEKRYNDFYLEETGGSLNDFEDFIKRSASEAGISLESRKEATAKAGTTQALSLGEKAKISEPSSLKSIPESVSAKGDFIATSRTSLPQEKEKVKENVSWESGGLTFDAGEEAEGLYDKMPSEEQAKFDLEMDDLRKTPEGNLFVAIKQLGGIRPYRSTGAKAGTKFMAEELKDIPAHLKNKNAAHTLDTIVSELKAFGWHFESGDELSEAIKAQAAHPIEKVNRAELRTIIREAEKNKKLQTEILDRMKKRRKFIQTVKSAEKTAPEVKQKIESRYEPITNAETLKQAQEYAASDYNEAVELVEGPGRANTFSNAVAIVLIDKAQVEGRWADAIRLVEKNAEKNTELGQAIQALAMYERLTPEGILQYAEKQVRRARENIRQKERLTNFEKLSKGLTSQSEKDKLAEKLGIPHISEVVAGELREMAEMIRQLPGIEDWPDFVNAPPSNAYQYLLGIFKKMPELGEEIRPDIKDAFQQIFNELKKQGAVPDTGENVPWETEFQRFLELGAQGVTGENVPWTTEIQETFKMGLLRMSRAKHIETALLLKKIAGQIPPGLGKKAAMIQTLAQLLNPKTFIRNILGNIGFQLAENISDTLGVLLDISASLRTGQRTVYVPNLAVQVKGLAQGMKEGTQEALLGINLKSGQMSKYTLPSNGVFDKGVMGALEKTLRISLSATDRAFYQAAFNQSIWEQCAAAGVEEPTEEMIERANYLGLYRTFQDDNVISNQFVKLKRWMNFKKDFGFGDIALKYPKTPANILARGIEYSPFGFIKTVFALGRPLFKRGPFKQEEFVRSASRAFTGALLVGAGAILAALGIISGKRAKDKDVAATRETVGIREYQLNTSALKRFIASGLDPDMAKIREDDTLITYDWFLPGSIGLALGANLILNPKGNKIDKALNLGDSFLRASETLQEQPLVRGVKILTSKQNLAEGFSDLIQDLPSSFIPTALNQIRQLTDNTARNTKDPNYFKEFYNKAIMRIPVVAGTLPEKIDTLGRTKEMYQLDSNNPFNVFLNPAFVNKYKPDPVSKMVLDIWESTGETIHFPRVAQAKIKLGSQTKEPIELTPGQYTEFQKYIGNKTDVLFTILSENKKFLAKSDDEKAKILQGYLTDINTAAKAEILGYRPKHVPHDVITIIKHIGVNKRRIDKDFQKEDLGFVPE